MKTQSLRQQSEKLNAKIKKLGLVEYEVDCNNGTWVFTQIYGQKEIFSTPTYHGMSCKISKFHRERVTCKMENLGEIRQQKEIRDIDIIESIQIYSATFGDFLGWMSRRYEVDSATIAKKLSEMKSSGKIKQLPGQPTQEEPTQEEPNQEEPNQEEPNQEEPNQEEPNQEEPNQEQEKPMSYIIRNTTPSGEVRWITPTGGSTRLKRNAQRFVSDRDADRFIQDQGIAFAGVEEYDPNGDKGLDRTIGNCNLILFSKL